MFGWSWLPFVIGWCAGWCLVARPRPLPELNDAASGDQATRSPISVIIPARDEADSLPRLLDRITPWQHDNEVIVVDDRSRDETAAIARSYGVSLVRSPGPRSEWLGKPYACWVGQDHASHDTLVFLDADVRPSTDFFERIGEAAAQDGCSSVLPWHQTVTIGEQLSLFPSIAALMGTGHFSILRRGRRVAFGPVMAFDASVYDAVGGHGAPTVRGAVFEDVALAQIVPNVGLYTGVRRRWWSTSDPACIAYRMYPRGARQAFFGWMRTLAAGLGVATWWALVATFGWMWAIGAAPFLGWWAYAMAVAQVAVIGRLAGRFRWWAPLVYPVFLVAFVAMVIASIGTRVLKRPVRWKGRRVWL